MPARGRRARRRAQLVTGGPAVGKALVDSARRRRHRLHRLLDVGCEIYRRFAVGDGTRGRASRRWAARTRPSSPPPPTWKGRERRPPLGLRRQRPEVLGLLAGASGGDRPRRVHRAPRREDQVVDVGDPSRADCRVGPVNNAATRSRSYRRARRRRATARPGGGRRRGADRRRVREGLLRRADDHGRPAGRATGCTRDELFVPFVVVGRRPTWTQAIAAANAQSLRPHRGLFQRGRRTRCGSSSTASRPAWSTSTARAGATTGAWPGYQSVRRLEGLAAPPANGLRAVLRAAVHARAVAHHSRVR